MRNAVRVYLPVFGGLAAGLAAGGFVLDADPAVAGWILGAGGGLMGGAFVAALAGNVPLAGRGGSRPRPASFPGDDLGRNGRNGGGDG